ncbi:hypothetical protein CQ010_18410 [Arthrobacter sp. MYb211]|uniref:SOS response-associated peptidase family protein n=1 Tax=unclassified Arthrobacter TaxID=235627 RepID=UPI000CFAA7AB|nr:MULTISPECIES: SOS response-associated peptidase family protein [unclassified Arthrobacter]PRA08167.1 hypothetical protein CQ015_18385 [Arthrobacter sp. MYb221]PRC02136.1 hypothetical protein CQ010_18410 [Arthrobacter sp. MYb211]
MTTTTCTRPAVDALGYIHDRLPVIVPADQQEDWLDPGLTGKTEIRPLLMAIFDPGLVPREVGKVVGNVRNNGAELVDPATTTRSEANRCLPRDGGMFAVSLAAPGTLAV